MKNLSIWFSILGAVAIAATANSIAAVWARGDRFSWWLVAVLLISPLVFISFGLVTSRIGLAVSSGVVDSLLTITTIAVGLLLFQEWNKISTIQYLGMALALTGVILMVFFRKEGA